MKMQLVNLYRPEFKRKRNWITANTIALAALSLTIFLGVLLVVIERDLKRDNETVSLLEQQKRSIEQDVVGTRPAQVSKGSYKADKKLASLRQSLALRGHLVSLIEKQALGNQLGFSQYLLGLSRQAMPSVSLDHIRISRSGTFVEFKGLASSPENVPGYLERLQTEARFSGSHFGLMSVAKSPDTSLYQFAFGFDSVFLASGEEKP